MEEAADLAEVKLPEVGGSRGCLEKKDKIGLLENIVISSQEFSDGF